MTPTQLEQTLLEKFRQLPEPFQLVVFNLLDSLLDLPSNPPPNTMGRPCYSLPELCPMMTPANSPMRLTTPAKLIATSGRP